MRKIYLYVPFVLLPLACAFFGTPPPPDSGIAGKTLMGPMCPVLVEGPECPDQSFQAMLTVRDLKGRKIAQFQTDEDGSFKVPLPPGEYSLHPESPEGKPYPFAEEQRFNVFPDEFTRIIVLYDSGIR